MTSWLQDREPLIAARWKGAVRPVEEEPEVRASLAELGDTLDRSFNRNADGLSTVLREEPVQENLRRVLAQLGPARLLRLLHWLSFSGLPGGGQVLSSLLRDDPSGAGQAVRAFIEELHRQELLARIFSRGRLQALLAACQGQQGQAA
ncbi:type IVB secretion system protein IcmW [Roseomonas mucosa]